MEEILKCERSQLAVNQMVRQWLPQSIVKEQPEESELELYSNQNTRKKPATITNSNGMNTKPTEPVEIQEIRPKKVNKFVNKYF